MNSVIKMLTIGRKAVLMALCATALTTAGSAQILFQENFNSLGADTTLGALGWESSPYYGAPVHVSTVPQLSVSPGDRSVSASPGTGGQMAIWLKPFSQALPPNTGLLTLTYDAYTIEASHNSAVCLSTGDALSSPTLKEVGWWISNHPQNYGWAFDARYLTAPDNPLSGSAFYLAPHTAGVQVTATTYLDFANRTAWGQLAVQGGETYTTPTYHWADGLDPATLPYVAVCQDWRANSDSGINADNILLTATPVPEPALTACAAAGLLLSFGVARTARRRQRQP
jgi:hypothetical protein